MALASAAAAVATLTAAVLGGIVAPTNPANTTISGISSGADFAVQMHVAFSADLHGGERGLANARIKLCSKRLPVARATTLCCTILYPLGFACSLACIGTKRIARGEITWPCTVTHVRSIHSGWLHAGWYQ
jgi:hypothetical protein